MSKPKHIIEVRCDYCKRMFRTNNPHSKYCSKSCRQYAYKESAKPHKIYAKSTRQYMNTCSMCHHEFESLNKSAKYCCKQCQKQANKIRVSQRRQSRINKIPRLKLRFQVFERDSFHCQYCGRGVEDDIKLRIDHVIPKSKHGLGIISNYLTACNECNIGKGDALIELNEYQINKLGGS